MEGLEKNYARGCPVGICKIKSIYSSDELLSFFFSLSLSLTHIQTRILTVFCILLFSLFYISPKAIVREQPIQ